MEYSWDDVYGFWSSFGVEDAIAKDLADLNPWIKDGYLVVNEEYSSAADIHLRLYGVMLYIWRFRTFTTTRFGNHGGSLRSMACADMLGMTIYIAELASLGVSMHHLSGFKKVHAHHRRYIGVVGLATIPGEAVMAELFKDDRVAPRLHEFETVLRDKHSWLQSLP